MCVAIKLARFLHLIWQVQRGRKSPENRSITPPRRAIFKGLRRAAVLFVLMVLEFSIALDENSGTTTGRVTCLPAQLSPTEALGLWHRVSTAQVIDDQPDLTLRQTAILLQIYLVPPPHTVRGLAAMLGVTKPVITRALDSLGALGLVDRVRDERDRRNVVIKRTVAGALYLEKFGDLIIDQARKI